MRLTGANVRINSIWIIYICRKNTAMKQISAVLLILCGVLLTACESVFEYEVDWAPVEIHIYAVDSAGNSIIQPKMPGMSLTYKGETYEVRDARLYYGEGEAIQTRAYLATLYGLYSQQCPDDSTTYRLCFGEIDGAADMDEDIVLKWPDGSSDTIHYHCSDHKEGKNPKCNRSWKLNGKKHDGSEFHFVK